MDKAFFKRVLIVIMGVCAITLLFSFVSLIIDAVSGVDLLDHAGISYSVMMFVKWTAVAIVCLLVPLFASYVFSCVSKNAIFSIASAVLSLLIAVCTITFICVLRKDILDADWSTNAYALLTGYMEDMLQIAVPCFIGCAYFTVNSVQSIKKTLTKADKEEE
ncbi:MAG: hypothetical protein K2N18_05145 [Clostridia bacterium]|nr:hypothetical protein [Clostridia bacterium]